MDEKMMICPECAGSRKINNMDMVEIICPACNGTGKVSACIPVPSTPASEHIGDVTEMIAQHGTNVAPSTPSSVPLPPDELLTDEEKINITNDVCKKNNTSWDEAWELPKLKTELIAIECYKAVAKAQQKKCHQSEAAIRADQNKKIGEWLEKQKSPKHILNAEDTELCWDECLKEIIKRLAKLQKGEEVK